MAEHWPIPERVAHLLGTAHRTAQLSPEAGTVMDQSTVISIE